MGRPTDLIHAFIEEVSRIHQTGSATEHSYRSAIEALFRKLDDEVQALNEPKRVQCGAPDFIVQRGGIVIGHIEAKDLDVGLRSMKGPNKAQQERYREALPNLIYTNCLNWDFYRDGELVASVQIANFADGIQPKPDQYSTLKNLLREFIAQKPQTITSPKDLAKRMAGKARLIKDVLANTLLADEDMQTGLAGQFQAFRQNLIHDITPEDFADIYAETIAYGMFAARLHDTTLESFSRQEALELLPKSNPFLRSLFSYVAGVDLDDRIAWIIDDLARIFQACDVASLMEGFGKLTGQNDPFLHFYETFLAAYNPAKRKARGVWYTPEPAVNFIVRAVDEVLQTEFGLGDGLADTSKVTIDWDTGQKETTKKGKIKKSASNASVKKDVHRVQILDPSAGTGTFLAEVIKQIAPKVHGVAPGMWSQYIEDDLIPRLNGFELLMASYAMCHMKLDMILTELGYQRTGRNDPSGNQHRLRVYLTNSLEEGEPANQTLLFSQWLSREAKGANTIKRDMPIMCVIGNPPYLGEGGVSEGWIGGLMDDYKKEPGGKLRLKERNSKWLNDLYVKFIRLSSHLLEKNGEGILGFITNHGFLDNPTFRGMRWHLLKTFDRIWVLDLHGSTKKKEDAPDGKADKNVFDIQQGVSIIIAVKRKENTNDLAEVRHGDIWGSRAEKHAILFSSHLDSPLFEILESRPPQYPFVRRDYAAYEQYEKGFLLSQFMPAHGNGIVTKRDHLNIHDEKSGVIQLAKDFRELSEPELRKKYALPNDVRDWRYEWAKQDVLDQGDNVPIAEVGYRLFDTKFIFYSGKSRGVVGWPVSKIMSHYFRGENIGLLTSKAHRDANFAHSFITDRPTEAIHFSATTGSNAMNFPLYLYPDEKDLDQTRQVNFENKLYKDLQKLAKHPNFGTPDEVATFDYIYGVLHCPAYRETFAEFLKIDFPRIPWPSTADEFWDISAKGGQLRGLHLMEPEAIGPTPFPFATVEGEEGANVIEKPLYKNGRVWINKTQYFDAVPEVAWNFYIGGYQPAQKWLKDRKGRSLSFDDVKHYQRILKILSETDRIMRTISIDILN